MFNKDRLRIAKELRGLSNTDFAEKLSCSISKVKQLLDVDKEINENDQDDICRVLNLPKSFFAGNDTHNHMKQTKSSIDRLLVLKHSIEKLMRHILF